MTIPIIITLCLLVLIAYVFDITASKTKIPTVILLIVLGFLVKSIANLLEVQLPDLNPILPILGTIGLILIVLEGSLELEIKKDKFPLIIKSSLVAIIPLFLVSFGLAYFLNSFYNTPFKLALTNVIPLGIISSAIAIPSAKNLNSELREFVTYETSLSDIFGVIFFNFVTLNDNIGTKSIGNFTIEMIIMLIISFIATLILALFLNNIKHHIKFIPMLILVILIYAISKIFHFPALIFILILGLFMGNIDELRHIKFIQKFHPINFKLELKKFHEITSEFAFLIRVLFFMLFGFLINVFDVINTNTLLWAMGVTCIIFGIRYLVFYVFKVTRNPLAFIAPRGLITILLFLSIPESQQISQVNKSLITQVIILSAFIMMFGLMKYKTSEDILSQ